MSDTLGFDFDFAVQAPFRMQPGLRRLAPGTPQLTPAALPHRGVSRHLREKLAVLWAFADDALCAVPGFDARPALNALAAHAAAEHPAAWQVDGARWRCAGLGWGLDADDEPVGDADSGWPEIGPFLRQIARPWRRAALLSLAFCEDFAIVDAAGPAPGTIPWLAVALPSVWAPAEKVGRPFAEIHAPVADNRLITGAAESLVKLVTGPERWERFVWTITPHPRLHAHPRRYPPERWASDLLADAGGATLATQSWWRTERQSFIPVPGTQQAVFCIGVDVQPLGRALAEPARAQRVHAALASMSDAVLAYRGLTDARAPLLAWLQTQASGTAPAA